MRLPKFIILFVTLLCATLTGFAQTPHNMDEDIRLAIPHYNCQVDDYTQYVPAALTLGLKVSGYEGRTGWGPMLTADAFSIASMAIVTQGLKHTIDRTRPDGGHSSFPSGHSATAFMSATMLHKEYGWRSPWWSIGGYTLATFTGVSRMFNDRHWMSDVATGAVIGIGSVHLGYYLSDLIFKNKFTNPAYETPVFSYDPLQKHYVAEVFFAQRFILGGGKDYFTGSSVTRGGRAGLSTDIPIMPGYGISAQLAANSLTYSSGEVRQSYDLLAGGYYNYHFAKRIEIQAKAMAGPAWMPGDSTPTKEEYHNIGCSLNAGIGVGLMLDDHFKIKAIADYQTIGAHKEKWLHSILVGWSAAWVW